MTREELKEAIASTIKENGQKAITAESLANLLNEIVDAAGSGGGSGGDAVTIMIDDENVAPNEKNAEAFATISNAYNNGVPVSVMAMYSLSESLFCMPIAAYAYDGENDIIILFVDHSFILEEVSYPQYIMYSDGTIMLS